MLDRLNKFDYTKSIEIIYVISENLLFNYPLDFLENRIKNSEFASDINYLITDIEKNEGMKISNLPEEARIKYLSFFNDFLYKKIREYIHIDHKESQELLKKIKSEVLA